jgi:sec-independent protein translocase protein TatB
MGFTEIALILFVALLVFGPEDLPVIARTLGRLVFQARNMWQELTVDLKDIIETPSNTINSAVKSPLNTVNSILNDPLGQKTDKKTDAQETGKDSGKVNLQKGETEPELLTYEDAPPRVPPAPSPLADLPAGIVNNGDGENGL